MAGFRSETQAGVKGAFMGVGKLITGVFAGVLGAEAVKGAVEAAASIQKQMEVVRFEFGKSGEALIKFADTAGVALGDSNRATDEASARFGLLFKSLGIGQKQAAGMTLGFEKLALSVNAIRGGGAAGAETLLRQIVLAAAGNTRGLKQMGIVVDATSEKIAAFKLGLINNMTQALTPAQKTQAIYAIATAHLGQTMALAKKHAGDLANVQARLSAEWVVAKERLGVALMPAVVSLLNFLSRSIPTTIGLIMRVFGDLKTSIVVAFSAIRPVFAPVIQGIRFVFDAFRGGGGITGALDRIKRGFEGLSAPMKAFAVAATAAFAVLATTVLGPITSIIALGVAFGEAYQRSARFREIIADIGRFIQARLLPPIRTAAGLIVDAFGRAFNFIEAHKKVFAILGASIAGIAVLIASPIANIIALGAGIALLYERSQRFRNIVQTAFAAVKTVVMGLAGVFRTLGGAIISTVTGASGQFRQMGSIIHSIFTNAVAILRPFARLIGGVIVAAVRTLQFVWQHFGKTITAVTKGFVSVIIATIRGALLIIKGIFEVFAGLVTGNWGKLWKGLKDIFHGFTTGIMASLRAWGHVIEQFFIDLWHTIEKIVLEGIEKVVHLLAKIPTGFTVFGHHFGFTNPFQGWDTSLQKTIDNIGKHGKAVAKATGDAMRRAGAQGPSAAAAAAQRAAAVQGAQVKKQFASLSGVLDKLKAKFKDASPSVRKAADAQILALRREAAGLVAAFTKGRITFKQFESDLSDLTSGKALANLQSVAKKIGDTISTGVASGVTGAMPAAQKVISNTLQNTIQAANNAIQSSVRSAKNNLSKIAGDLAKTIQQIQDKMGGAAGALAGSPQGKAFAKLKKLIESGAPSFEIARARAALSSQLQNVGKQTKTTAGTQLQDLAAQFNQGKITYAQFNRRLHEILRKDGITMREALKAGGKAFADTFHAQVAALGKQAKAIDEIPAKFRGIGGAGGAADIKIIRPLEVIRNEQARIRVAEQKNAAAQLKATQTTNQILRSFKQVHVGPLPGHGKTPHGRGSHAARRGSRTGANR